METISKRNMIIIILQRKKTGILYYIEESIGWYPGNVGGLDRSTDVETDFVV